MIRKFYYGDYDAMSAAPSVPQGGSGQAQPSASPNPSNEGPAPSNSPKGEKATAQASPVNDPDKRVESLQSRVSAVDTSPLGDRGGWPLWEIFIRSKQGLDHKHVGSLHATDAQMAVENARDVYTRRQEGVSIWVVESKHVHASNPDEAESFYEPANDKVYRHPTFYDLPDEVNHM